MNRLPEPGADPQASLDGTEQLWTPEEYAADMSEDDGALDVEWVPLEDIWLDDYPRRRHPQHRARPRLHGVRDFGRGIPMMQEALALAAEEALQRAEPLPADTAGSALNRAAAALGERLAEEDRAAEERAWLDAGSDEFYTAMRWAREGE